MNIVWSSNCNLYCCFCSISSMHQKRQMHKKYFPIILHKKNVTLLCEIIITFVFTLQEKVILLYRCPCFCIFCFCCSIGNYASPVNLCRTTACIATERFYFQSIQGIKFPKIKFGAVVILTFMSYFLYAQVHTHYCYFITHCIVSNYRYTRWNLYYDC